MAFEVDFLPVGDGSRSGDAIAMRMGDLVAGGSSQSVIVIDGGFQDSGQALVDHIETYYHTDTVDLVVCSHSDQDHSSGLSVVLDQLTVKRLWLHLPWEHSAEIREDLKFGKISDMRVSEKVRRSMENVDELYKQATRLKIPVQEPFQGLTFSNSTQGFSLHVLGPSQDYYEELLTQFRSFDQIVAKGVLGKFPVIERLAEAVKTIIEETWDYETIDDDDTTSAENNSSTVMLLREGDSAVLFTADSGITGLSLANEYARSQGIILQEIITKIQIPHHGSKRNVGPAVLDSLLGPKISQDNPRRQSYVSAAKDGAPKHPSQRVINAFRRRGCKTYGTTGGSTHHTHQNAPARQGWSEAPELPFKAQFDDQE